VTSAFAGGQRSPQGRKRRETQVSREGAGELARLGALLGDAGVNIHGMATFTGEGRGVIHLLVDDEVVERCQGALEADGMGVADTREVIVVDIDDRPGSLGELTRRLAAENVNVDLADTTFGGVRVVIATDDMANARRAVD
jgi:hypothetical protein